MAVGLGADVTILDRDPEVLEKLDNHFEGRASTIYSGKATLAALVADADLVIGAVLIPGAAAPKLVTRDMLATMRPGAVLVDVAIDQGGCFETSHATTHADPTYVVDDVVHYCVANMPGGVARTSTYALNNVTLPHALRSANLGWKAALKAKGPSMLVLSRQKVPHVRTTGGDLSAKGAYELKAASSEAKVTIFASGTEVPIAVAAQKDLEAQGIATRVVSTPSWDLFEAQDPAYKASVIGTAPVRIAVEAAMKMGWERFIGEDGHFVGMTGFGASAP
eukprot:gene35978-46044_t